MSGATLNKKEEKEKAQVFSRSPATLLSSLSQSIVGNLSSPVGPDTESLSVEERWDEVGAGVQMFTP